MKNLKMPIPKWYHQWMALIQCCVPYYQPMQTRDCYVVCSAGRTSEELAIIIRISSLTVGYLMVITEIWFHFCVLCCSDSKWRNESAPASCHEIYLQRSQKSGQLWQGKQAEYWSWCNVKAAPCVHTVYYQCLVQYKYRKSTGEGAYPYCWVV